MSLAAPSTQAPERRADGPIRVMVVDDSVVIRGLLTRWLNEVEGVEVVASHRNGLLAVNDVEKSAPDVIVLDIEMPEMDGITALPLLRRKAPKVAIIIASTLTQRNAEMSLRALSLGAKDYIPKPEGNRGVTTSTEFRRSLIEKVTAIGATVCGRPTGPVSTVPAREALRADAADGPFKLRPFSRTRPRILAIGSSTGGPQALQAVFSVIGEAVSQIPVVVTQHMPATFTAILAEHIAKTSGRPCREGVDGEPLVPGRIYVAPGGKHMVLTQRNGQAAIELNDGPPVNFCKPAVDPLFDSVVRVFGGSTLAAVLTGMGSDGARGAVHIADAGGSVIAQDEASSVVWGMPGATTAAGACAAVLPLGEIGQKIKTLLAGRPG